jgi:hypothetical protein
MENAAHIPTKGSTTSGTGAAASSASSVLPAWAQMAEDTRAQPWRQHAGAESDDRDYAQGKDTVPFYDARLQVCYGEGSMAA